jgi:DNA-binding Lrp family transcriptional regulator
MKITDKRIFNEIVKNGYNLTKAAKALGRSREWLSKRVHKTSHLFDTYASGRSIRVDNAEDALDKLIADGDANAVKFTLSTLGRSRGYGKSIEITGDASKPVAIIASEMKPEEAAKLYQETLNSDLES